MMKKDKKQSEAVKEPEVLDEDIQQDDQQKEEIEKKMIEISEEEYQNLLVSAEEYKDKYLRVYAEFENARKRMDRDKLEFVKYAKADMIGQFLEVMDDLERTVAAAKAKHQDVEALQKGIEMVMGRIHSMLEKNGVKPMDAQGKIFDPHSHEVLMQEENDDVEENTVVDVFQKGYFLGDRVVRTAKVKLAKKKNN